jgi:hypothetical protein
MMFVSQVLPILKRLRALHNDVRAKVSSNGFDPYDPDYPRSFSQTALSHEQIYGAITSQIETSALLFLSCSHTLPFSEVRALSQLLHTPVLPSTLMESLSSNLFSVFKAPYGSSITQSLHGIPAIAQVFFCSCSPPHPPPQGSILPVANQKLKAMRSFVTGQLIQGPMVWLEDRTTCMMTNEAIMWKLVNPYSPLCTGKFLEHQ